MKKNNLIKLSCLFFIFLFIFYFFRDDLVGLVSILLIVFLTFTIAKIYPAVGPILITALVIRIFIIYLGNIFTLPDSTKDAVYFENVAYEWSQDGFLIVLFDHYPGQNSKFICWIIAIFYSLFGRSILLAQSLSLFFGMSSIFFCWLLAKKLWGNSKAIKVGWLIAFFPSLILYSVLIMREVYVAFFLLIAIFGVVNWSITDNFRWIILALFGFIAATFFHGAMIVGGIVFVIIVGLIYLKNFFVAFKKFRLNYKYFWIFGLFLIVSISYFSNQIGFAKVGNFEDSFNMSRLSNIMNSSSRGAAAYPDWLQANSINELIYKTPIRAAYFLFSPFPWDVKKLNHLIGLFDAFLYILLFYFIFRNYKVFWKDPVFKIILLILASYFFVFGVGVGNFGTGLRHRSKFVLVLILLAAPFIPKFVFSTKKTK
jgi:4-amino-4-deoxy-L-arabinose transferase-like glycosyltransferase